MRTILGGYFIGADSSRTRLDVMTDPDDVTIEKTIASVARRAAVLGMRRDPIPEFGPYELSLYAQDGQFLIMLNEVIEDGENNTKTLTNHTAANDKFIVILGEKYPAKAVIDDIELVRSIFLEFAHTGSVSNDLLS
ncbi:hypothetical protein PQQ51_18645 [Paraburkholderia xenovorans]|uniref:DUF6911 family protein n=1 Tax=Paraburkholderia xenovorans TaxID=36873 RepID=UPI0038B96705